MTHSSCHFFVYLMGTLNLLLYVRKELDIPVKHMQNISILQMCITTNVKVFMTVVTEADPVG